MNQNSKKKLKSLLYISSISLAILLLGVIGYGIFFELPISTQIEKQLGQIKRIDITKETEKTVATISEQEDLVKGLAEISTDEKKLPTNQKTGDSPKADTSLTKLPESTDLVKEVAEVKGPKGKITVVLTNLGTSEEITKSALELDNNFTLGFSAFTTSFKQYFLKALDRKFEVYIYMPFEPSDYPISDPGPYALLTRYESNKNLSIMKGILAEFVGAKGVYGTDREVFTFDHDSFMPVLQALTMKNMNVILGHKIQSGTNDYLKNHDNILFADIVLDNIADDIVIKNNLKKLEILALNNGSSVGYVNTYPITLEILKEWSETLKDRDLELVTASELVELRKL